MARRTRGRKVARPAQGNNSTPAPSNKFPKTIPAGGDNVRTSGGPARVSNNRKRGYAS